jgi:hypothetical protein
MGLLYRAVRAGTLDAARAERLLDGLTTTRVRVLGDRVSRAVARRIATEHGRDDIAPAEYVAVARLQADVLVASDADLAARARGLVELAPVEDLLAVRPRRSARRPGRGPVGHRSSTISRPPEP